VRCLVTSAVLVAIAASASPAAAAGCPPGYARGAPGDTLRVGYAVSPPFVVARPGAEPTGLAVDALRAAARDGGWRLQLEELSPRSLRARVRACSVDVGLTGEPISIGLEAEVDAALPFHTDYATVATHGDAGDGQRARRPGRFQAVGHGVLGAVVALGLLAVGVALVNARLPRRRGGGPWWHRVDGAVGGPWSALRWLWWCPGGRVLGAAWLVAGVVVAVVTLRDRHAPSLFGADRSAALVAASLGGDALIGARVPDRAHVRCAAGEGRDCVRALRDGMLSALAGSRLALCRHAADAGVTGLVLHPEAAVLQQHAFLLPPGSPLAEPLDRALLRGRGRGQPEVTVRCEDRP
jgi:ABC-type amino acid transport substrate-binding protein